MLPFNRRRLSGDLYKRRRRDCSSPLQRRSPDGHPVLHEEQYGGRYLVVIEDDGLGVNRMCSRTINEVTLLLAPELDDHPTYNEAALKVIEDFKAYATSSGGTR